MPKRTDNFPWLATLHDLPREQFRERLRANLTNLTNSMGPMNNTATAYLTVKGAAAAIDFYKRAFGAEEVLRLTNPDGTLGHAEVSIGGSNLYLADEHPGIQSPLSLGGSTMKMHLYVDDADAAFARAVAAGAKIQRPPNDEFYGDRSGVVEDPFGYSWVISARKESLTQAEMQRRYDELMKGFAAPAKVNPIRAGFRTVNAYLISPHGPELLEFVKQAFGAEETMRSVGSAGGMHAEVRLGDCMVMIGGGYEYKGPARTCALHLHVPDVDATYQRALAAGATSLSEPTDQPYGERGASVKDIAGNFWYIATVFGESYSWPGLPQVQPYLHAAGAGKAIDFLVAAFGGEDLGRHAGPDGMIYHATVRIGTATVELSDAHGPYQPMPSTFYMYVDDVDAVFARAVEAGATAMYPPADQPYGDRNAGVSDPFGNEWYISTHIADVTP